MEQAPDKYSKSLISSSSSSPIQKVADIGQQCRSLLETRDTLVNECKKPLIELYGAGIEKQKCIACDGKVPVLDHCLPPNEETTMLALEFLNEMIKCANYNDQVDLENSLLFKENKTTGKYTGSYCLGVLQCIGIDCVVFYVDCSGKGKNIPTAFTLAKNNLKNKFHGVGDTPICEFDENGDVKGVIKIKRLPAKKGSEKNTFDGVEVESCDNTPGFCAGPKLVASAIRDGFVPVGLTELYISPDNSKMKSFWASCATCQLNFQPMLCGLKDHLDEMPRRIELERISKAKQEKFALEEAQDKEAEEKDTLEQLMDLKDDVISDLYEDSSEVDYDKVENMVKKYNAQINRPFDKEKDTINLKILIKLIHSDKAPENIGNYLAEKFKLGIFK